MTRILCACACACVASLAAAGAVAQVIPREGVAVTHPVATPDTIVLPADLKWAPFKLPGFCGPVEAAFVNMDTDRAPFIALLRMPKGSLLARHFHTRQIEAVHVLEGTMLNNGTPLPKGSTLLHAPGVIHGPHTTNTGTTLMFIQYGAVGPEDSIFVDADDRVMSAPPACAN
jgi:anti-sigma factor ChrR (cupin superfamily)